MMKTKKYQQQNSTVQRAMSNLVRPMGVIHARRSALRLFSMVLVFSTLGFVSDSQAQIISFFEEGDEVFVPDEELEPVRPVDSEADEADEGASGVVIERGSAGSGAGVGTTRSIRLEYERRGQSILVPARVASREVYFIFDTGASYTTLTSDFAARVGASPRPTYPSAMVQTAGGVMETQFSLMNALRLGSQRIENVSFTVCDACGGYEHQGLPIVGLLGLNVLRRYRVSVDDSSGVVELEPHSDFDDRSADLEPWIQSEITDVSPTTGDSPEVSVTVSNQAPKQVRNMVLEFQCTTISRESRSARTGTISSVPSQSSREVTVRLNPAGCVQIETHVIEGQW